MLICQKLLTQFQELVELAKYSYEIITIIINNSGMTSNLVFNN